MNDSAGVGIVLLELISGGYAVGCSVIAILTYKIGRVAAVVGVLTGLLVIGGFLVAIAQPIERRALLSAAETIALNFLLLGAGWVLVASIAYGVGMHFRRSRRLRTPG